MHAFQQDHSCDLISQTDHKSHPFPMERMASLFFQLPLMSQTPAPISNAPIKKTHFGIRHAKNIPTPTAINIMPPSHLIGAPLHLLRILIPPLSPFICSWHKNVQK